MCVCVCVCVCVYVCVYEREREGGRRKKERETYFYSNLETTLEFLYSALQTLCNEQLLLMLHNCRGI